MSAVFGSGSKIYKAYISQTLGELYDELGWMMIYAPTLIDPGGHFPEQNIETAFAGLNGGLDTLRGKLCEERHAKIRALPDEVRALFEANPETQTGQAIRGCQILQEMETLLLQQREGAV